MTIKLIDGILTVSNSSQEKANVVKAVVDEMASPAVINYSTLLAKTYLLQDVLAKHPDFEQYLLNGEIISANCEMVLIHELDLAWYLHAVTHNGDLKQSLFWAEVYVTMLEAQFDNLVTKFTT